MPGPAWPEEGAAQWTSAEARVVCPSPSGKTLAASLASDPEGARFRSRRRPLAERGKERAMDPKAGGGEEDDCVDSGAETGG